MSENYIGSDFDDFLAEEGLLEEAEALAVKRILAFQIKELMESQNLSKTEMARRLQTSRAALECLLDPENPVRYTAHNGQGGAVITRGTIPLPRFPIPTTRKIAGSRGL
jgi:antitoxin HicB